MEPAVREAVAGAGEVNMLCNRGKNCGSCGHEWATVWHQNEDGLLGTA